MININNEEEIKKFQKVIEYIEKELPNSLIVDISERINKIEINYNEDIIKATLELLNLLGMPRHKLGYSYIIESVLLWNNKHLFSNCITSVYKQISIKHNKSVSSIEKAIRACIEYTFLFGNTKELNKIFANTISMSTGKISNKKFISTLSKRVNNFI